VDAMGMKYNPQTKNIMSYSWDNCREIFTQEQYARMRFNFDEYHYSMSCSNVPTTTNTGNTGNTGGGGGSTPPPNPNDAYCKSSGNSTNFGWIAGVKLSNINHVTQSDQGYGNFLDIVADVNQGETYELRLTPRLNVFAPTGWKAWIDFDQSNTFESTEMVTTANFNSFQQSPHLADITIPEDAMVGETRMRVVYVIGGNPTDCGSFVYGETEDYTINLKAKVIVDVCSPKGGNTQWGWIKRVQLNSLDNESNDEGGYADFTGNEATVIQGATYPLTVTQGGNFGNTKNWKVWIDFNQDEDFDDAGELVSTGETRFTNPSLTNEVTFPNDALGAMKMRVALGAFNSLNGPCDDILYGDIEDYTIMVNKSHCASNGANTNYEWIDGININLSDTETFENNSGNDNGYGDYSNSMIQLAQNTNYPFMLIPGFNGASYNEIWTIWIDLNIDGDFDDAGERVFQTPNGTPETVTGDLLISDNSLIGRTKMRISLNWENTSSGIFPSPCGEILDGEVEDYSIEIVPENSGADFIDISSFLNVLEANIVGTPSVKPRDGFDMTLYPNPTNGTSRLQLTLGAPRESQISIFSIAGQLIKVIDLGEVQSIDYQLDMEDLVRGAYLVQVRGDDFNVTKRLVVLK
jgi:hypothetical protein